MTDPIGAYLLVSHAWGHPLAPWGTINGVPILDIAGDNMINPVEASVLAVGIDAATEGPDVSERLVMLAEKLGVNLDSAYEGAGSYEGDVVLILEALYERISAIEASIKRLEDRP